MPSNNTESLVHSLCEFFNTKLKVWFSYTISSPLSYSLFSPVLYKIRNENNLLLHNVGPMVSLCKIVGK